MWLRKKKKKKNPKLKSLIRFHSANKINNYNGGGERKKIQKSLQNNSKHQNNKCLSWVTAVRVLSLAGTHSPRHLPRMPSNTVLVSGPAVGAAQTLIWSYSCVFLPPMSTAVRTSAFSFVGALDCLLHIPQTHSLPSWSCGFNSQLVQLVGGFGSSSLVTLPLGFNCGFVSNSVCGSSTGVCSWGCPGGLGFVSVMTRCGGGAAVWVAVVLAAPGTQGG